MSGTTLLLGSSGQLGTALTSVLDDFVAPPRIEVDLATLTHDAARHILESMRPSLLINAAAYTAVDKAEEEADLADQVNGTAVGVLAEVTAELGIPFVTYSSDYVFSGEAQRPYLEWDKTDPVNAYGRSKRLGEHLALEANPDTLLVRTSWMISGTHPNFVATMLRLAAQGKTLSVVNDQQGCPTLVDDLARATVEAVSKGATGLLHLTNQEPTTWFYLAQAAVHMAGMDPGLIEACTTADYPTPARRPAYSVLGSERREGFGIAPLPHWQDSLPEMVRELLAH